MDGPYSRRPRMAESDQSSSRDKGIKMSLRGAPRQARYELRDAAIYGRLQTNCFIAQCLATFRSYSSFSGFRYPGCMGSPIPRSVRPAPSCGVTSDYDIELFPSSRSIFTHAPATPPEKSRRVLDPLLRTAICSPQAPNYPPCTPKTRWRTLKSGWRSPNCLWRSLICPPQVPNYPSRA
jgi:hypothetical protein